MRTVTLVQFLSGWILSVALGAVAVLMFGLPGLVVLVGLMIGAHFLLNRRGVGPSAGPQLPGPADGD